jgi:NTE family protein
MVTRRTPRTSRPAPLRPSRRAGPGSSVPPPAIDLALQGGGSHGAFTWGVLDRLLEDDAIAFDGISGTSAGAMNAAVMATGLAEGGRAGARAALRAFWLDVADAGACFGSLVPEGAEIWAQAWSQLWGRAWMQAVMPYTSPYTFAAFDWNPLRTVLERHVREDALRQAPVQLFITATAVRTGQPRIFRREDLSLDALLASACLPRLFQAVVIDGEPYWDGGYSGNPALWPLIYETRSLDLMLVRINPLVHADLPDTAAEIDDRLNALTFNAGLVGELRAIHFVQQLVGQGRLDAQQYKNLRLHMIGDDAHLSALGASSKLDTSRQHLQRLHAWGRTAADDWLAAHRPCLGVRGTVDIERDFLRPRTPPGAATPPR